MITRAPPSAPCGSSAPQWKTKGPDFESPGLSSFVRARLRAKLLICQYAVVDPLAAILHIDVYRIMNL